MKSKIRRSVYCLKSSQISVSTSQRLSAAFRRAWDHFSRTANWRQLTTVVLVLQWQRSRMCPTASTFVPVLQTREFTTLWALCLHISYMTDKGMLVKEIKQYRDPWIWILHTPLTVRHIFTPDIILSILPGFNASIETWKIFDHQFVFTRRSG